MSYPNLTKSRWDILGQVKLKLGAASTGNIEVFDCYGVKIYQIQNLKSLNSTDLKDIIKRKCIGKCLEVNLKLLNSSDKEVGQICLLGDEAGKNDRHKIECGVIDQYQSKIIFPLENDCVHKEKQKALLLTVTGICRCYINLMELPQAILRCLIVMA